MEDDLGYQEEPLDFSQPHASHCCPYCGETLSADEVESYMLPESNTFVCPNCRKKLNMDELSNEI